MVQLSLQSFKTRRSRIVLTVLGVAVGIAVIMFLVSVGYGLQKTILDRITTAEALLTLDITSPDEASLPLTDNVVRELQDVEDVADVTPQGSLPAQIALEGLNSETSVYVVEPEYFSMTGLALGEGNVFSDEDTASIVISNTVAQLLGKDAESMLGASIDFTFASPISDDPTIILEPLQQSFVVTGVLEENVIANEVYMKSSRATRALFDNYALIKVQVEDQRTLENVRTAVIEKGFIVSASSDLARQAEQVFTVLQVILGIFGVFSLLVAAIGLVNTMTISLLERTNEIGIMRAVGASRRDIQGLFLIESSLIGFLGGVVGLIAGALGGVVFNIILNIVARALGGQSLDIFATPFWFVLVVLTFSVIVGFASGFFPARRASRLNTLAALRYK